MAADRVDKSWGSKGLGGYTVEAILGTLKHYGVSVTEAAFKASAEKMYPLDFVRQWVVGWKGTGQFGSFPLAAADELWHRWVGEKLNPDHLTHELMTLMALLTAQPRSDTAEVTKAFEVLEGHKAEMPGPGDLREQFVAEMVFRMDDALSTFNRLGETLAGQGRGEEALRFVAFEEFLFPVREGSATALVKAALGKKEEAIADLIKIADDAKRDPHARLSAVDALLHFEEIAKAKPVTLAMLELAQEGKDLELAVELAERLRFIANSLGPSPERAELLARVMALIDQLEGPTIGRLEDP
ncbi:MAG: hypothetical protein K1X64_03365 [Myxococcaceae bacterium]|nr:hypothetical protein [Myxococcaceae bacterium]